MTYYAVIDTNDEVLHREKFHFKESSIQMVLTAVKEFGMEVFPQPTGEIFVDMDDLIFYEAAMEKRDDGDHSREIIRRYVIFMNNSKYS